MALGLTESLVEMLGIFLGGKGRPMRKVDNLVAICKRIV
jgi:hypothetical protein